MTGWRRGGYRDVVAKDHRDQVGVAALESVVLAIACLITYMLVTDILPRVYALSRADDLIGGLWP